MMRRRHTLPPPSTMPSPQSRASLRLRRCAVQSSQRARQRMASGRAPRIGLASASWAALLAASELAFAAERKRFCSRHAISPRAFASRFDVPRWLRCVCEGRLAEGGGCGGVAVAGACKAREGEEAVGNTKWYRGVCCSPRRGVESIGRQCDHTVVEAVRRGDRQPRRPCMAASIGRDGCSMRREARVDEGQRAAPPYRKAVGL
mmetsp:Transcript_84844/g.169522  ORF Transcript_84844/g.169522 Transcript_84844/m.169522 type:complete len:204 (-) Transcript_84844:370-981(-)